ncbi:putative chromate transporter [Actinoplanes missouriensis 431]|uniref:Putative chromate transporter n=1 Tax=Actinoplanes missouriensis (strain ATCC 14538 / DSM 43046 / CBS 188.64 / JCM 3121 / NBRC 102363 / NCIMB 12654 / NRRL B-3342 / UNCC 431) TaxID=512565 RepID=I0H5F5_ACTM4|nr:chromate efflux transporter [Actinoplanes missouriensis]BAL88242.1 putative chromate transporter [Actinoplanes missouriensis 431]
MTGPHRAGLGTVLTEWGRIGCIGFGGPPAHIALLRKLCVEDRRWLDPQEFEDAIAACNLLPGPASTQLAIFCAWRVRGRAGALVGGAAFILPGLVAILALAALFLGDPPTWVKAAGAGAGAAVAAIALQAGTSLIPAGWKRATQHSNRRRWAAYLLLGTAAAATVGPWLVLVLIACGIAEILAQRLPAPERRPSSAVPLLAAAGLGGGVLLPLAWTALKVGALSYGGGFVIIPLMQADAVEQHHWMTAAEFLNAVALGQITPGPVVHTVAVVGYAAAGLAGGLLAAAVAFSPSFAFILLGADRFDRLRGNQRVRAFLDGAGPAAVGAILGSAVPLVRALSEPWQYAVLAGAALLTLGLRRGPVLTLLTAATAGAVIVAAGGGLPG